MFLSSVFTKMRPLAGGWGGGGWEEDFCALCREAILGSHVQTRASDGVRSCREEEKHNILNIASVVFG